MITSNYSKSPSISGLKIFLILLLATFIISVFYVSKPADAQTVTSTTSSKNVSITTTKDSIKTDNGVVVLKYSYKMPVIKSNKKAAAKINSFFTNKYKGFMKDEATILSWAKETSKDGNFLSYYSMSGTWTLTYSSSSIISFKYVYSDYVGGAHGDTSVSGVTFNLNTGNRVYINSYISGTSSQIKSKIISAYKAFGASHKEYIFWETNESMFKKTKISKFPFYLTDSSVVFYYSPYTLAPYAAGVVSFSIDYK